MRKGARRVTSSARLGAVKLAQVAHVLQVAGVVIEAEEEGADERLAVILVPAEAGDDAVAVALVLNFEHGAFVGFVGAGEWFGR